MDLKILGERLKYARNELRNMSLQDIADAVGVARSTVQRYENGKIQNIKLPVVESFARALGVNPAWLIGKSDDIKIPSSNGIPISQEEKLTSLIEQIQHQYGDETSYAFSLYLRLDDMDKGKITERMEIFLEDEKYKKILSKNA